MKKIFALALLLILTVAIAPSKSFANENNDFISSNPITIENYDENEEAIQSNIGSTTFAPEQSDGFWNQIELEFKVWIGKRMWCRLINSW